MLINSFDPSNGQKDLLNVKKVANGWLVTVYNLNRDKTISEATLAKREKEKEIKKLQDLEKEKARLKQDLLTQIEGVKLIGEVAVKAQMKGIDKHTESWKYEEDEEKENPPEDHKKLDETVAKLAQANLDSRNFFPASDYLNSPPAVETHIFTDREEMIRFVCEMLHPIEE
jgi:hypothetical protein